MGSEREYWAARLRRDASSLRNGTPWGESGDEHYRLSRGARDHIAAAMEEAAALLAAEREPDGCTRCGAASCSYCRRYYATPPAPSREEDAPRRIVRNESTPKTKAIWDNLDRVAARAPSREEAAAPSRDEELRRALNAYPDSDLVSLAETMRRRLEALEELEPQRERLVQEVFRAVREAELAHSIGKTLEARPFAEALADRLLALARHGKEGGGDG